MYCPVLSALRTLAFMERFDEGLGVLASNITWITGTIFTNKKVSGYIANKDTHIVLYGPTPEQGTPWLSNGRIKIGKLAKRKIYFEPGRKRNQGGRLLGIGSIAPKQAKDLSESGHQWFRMDWHSLEGKKKHNAHDMCYRPSALPYHFHSPACR